MRKHITVFICIISILLCCSGCRDNSAQHPGAAAAVSGYEQADPTYYTASAAQSPTTTPDNAVAGAVVLPGGNFPDTPYAPVPPPARYYAQTTLELIQGDNYGRIWPYIGGYIESYWMQSELIGLCDESGKIICDPAYNQVNIIEQGGKRLYRLVKNRRDEEGNDISGTTLAKLDGSWVHCYEDISYMSEEPEYIWISWYTWRQPIYYEYISVKENGLWGVIDYEGNQILPCKYKEPVCFSEGLAAVLSEDGETYGFIDVRGAEVLGPYPTAQQQPEDWSGSKLPWTDGVLFSEGRVRYCDREKYGVIDREGQIVIPAKYDFVTSYYNATAQVVLDGKRGIIDMAGNTVLAPTEEWFWHTEGGAIILSKSDAQYELDPKTGKQTPWVYPEQSDFQISYLDDGTKVTWEGGELVFPQNIRVNELGNGNLILSDRDTDTWEIITRDKKKVAGPNEGAFSELWDGYILISLDQFNQTSGYLRQVYDINGRRILPESCNSFIPLDGWLMVRQPHVAGLLDEEGNWVIKVSVYDYMSD